ncbi:DUF6443 domain-containing protein [Ekhidna sp.]|uniref:DUF6443 domain-containing protein n=1 Tax=Ekhidna sp. TaxID=2608089 RepID=UPI003299B00A
MRKNIYITLVLVVASFFANAQTWELVGPTSVCPGQQNVSYSVQSSGGGIPFGKFYWSVDGQSVPGTSYSNQIDFPSSGSSFLVRATNLMQGINVSLTVYSIGADPGSIILSGGPTAACGGNDLTLDASGYSGNVKWQKKTGSGPWGDYALGFPDPLLDENVTVGTTYSYRVRTQTTCAAQYSNTITVTLANPLNGGSVSNQSVCSGETPSSITATSASGGAGNYTYSWEKKPASGGSWTNIGGGISLSSSEIGALTQATQFKRKVIDTQCGVAYTNTMTVNMHPNLSSGSIGNAQTVCYNGNPSTLTNTTSASGGNGSISYQWQYSTNGTNGWTNLNGQTGTTYNPPALTSNRWYRRRAISCNMTVYTNSIKITVHPSLSAGSISNAQTLCYNGNPAALTSTGSASGGDGNLSYQWQYSLNGSTGWTNLSGQTGTTYNPPALTQSRWYRRRVISCGETKYTNSVKITIHPDLNPGAISGAQSICYNNAPSTLGNTTSATGGGSGLTYQWQESTNGISFTNISGTSATYQPGILTADRWYRRGASTNDCSIEYTSSVKVTVDATTNGGSLEETVFNSSNVEVFGTTDVNLALTGEVGNIIKWQYKTTGDWVDIANTTDTHNEINVTVPTYYRVEVKNGTCATGYSNEVFVNVFPEPGLDFGLRTSVRPGSGTTISVDAGYSNYQWFKDEVSVQSGSSNELQITHPAKYRVKITSGGGATFETGNATIGSQLDEDQTYVMVYDFREAGYTANSDLFGIPMENMSITADVYDGLGRPIQKINMEGSPNGSDLVAPVEYDEFGRNKKSYLPYPTSDNGQLYKPDALGATSKQKAFYDAIYSSDTAFSENKFEASPLNRVVEQGLPGEKWAIGSDHSVKMQYLVNEANENIRIWRMVNSLPEFTTNDYYPDGKLFKSITTDENGAQTITYTNFRKDPILIRKQIDATKWAKTYYIYDQRNRLRVVLQPEGVKNISTYDSATTQEKEDFLAAWAFQYGYDAQNRQIWKQVPGAGRMYTVYDAWDRVRMTSDSVQSENKEWSFIKYDVLNRPIITGIRTSDPSLEDQGDMTANVEGDTSMFESYSTTTHTYSDNMYPSTSTNVELLTVTFYDNYDFLLHTEWASLDLGFSEATPQRTPMTAPLGTVTGTKTKVSDGTWIYSTSHYDDKGRLIQARSTNHLGGVDVVTNYYNFANEVTQTITEHSDGTTTTTITRDFEYDHRGRLLKTWHAVDGAPAILLAENEYNELDEVAEKCLHSTDGTDFEQYVDYTYNIRRWLTAVNDSDLSSNDPIGDLFGMELAYDQAVSGLGGNQYNGNISAMRWSNYDVTGSGPDTRAYTYNYDKLSRLTAAQHYEGASSVDQFSVSSIGYDENGNIESLIRKGDSGANMDSLTYDYGTGLSQSNQLQYVDDLSADALGFDNNGTGTATDYTYDANGNMVKDRNKGIDSIYYNHLNLPIIVDFEIPGDSMRYVYDAAGIKLRQTVYEGGSAVKTTDYVGEFIYEDLHDTNGSNIKQIQHEEGRLVYMDYESTWDYQYNLKDHLGNVRVTFSTEPDNYEATAYFEDATMEQDTIYFGNVDTPNRVNHPLVSNTGKAARVNNVAPAGPYAVLRVNKGDTVSMSVNAYYNGGSGYTNSLDSASMVAALATAFGSSNVLSEAGVTYNQVEFGVAAAIGILGVGGSSNDNVPGAYLNYLLFDMNMSYQNVAGFTQISSAANGAEETISLNDRIMDRDGYLVVYLSNESNTSDYVYFDDFTIYHGKTNIVQTDDYYPFGLTFNSTQRSPSVMNAFKYNGKEYDENTQWYDYGARMYQADLGRWFSVDPLGEKFMDMTTYKYGMNNPILFIDPDGRSEIMGGYGQVMDQNNTGAVTHYDYGGGSDFTGNAQYNKDHPPGWDNPSGGGSTNGVAKLQKKTEESKKKFSYLFGSSGSVGQSNSKAESGFLESFTESWSNFFSSIATTFSSVEGFTNTFEGIERSILNLNTSGIDFDPAGNAAKLSLYNAALDGNAGAWGTYAGIYSQFAVSMAAPELVGAGISGLKFGLYNSSTFGVGSRLFGIGRNGLPKGVLNSGQYRIGWGYIQKSNSHVFRIGIGNNPRFYPATKILGTPVHKHINIFSVPAKF